jgi:hypothetical protein
LASLVVLVLLVVLDESPVVDVVLVSLLFESLLFESLLFESLLFESLLFDEPESDELAVSVLLAAFDDAPERLSVL